jgi:iron-sulfur cluster assembly protein
MIRLTPEAAEQIHASAAQGGMQDMPLRIAAKETDDGGVQFGMGFDEERDNDVRFDAQGVTLLVSAVSAPYLVGMTVDFVDAEEGAHFVFLPPDDAPDGGCGSGGCGGGGCGSGHGGGCG